MKESSVTVSIDACCTIGGPGDTEPPAERLLEVMDRVGLDRAVCHPPDRGYAWANEEANDLTLSAAREHPTRFIASITASPWRPDAWAVIEQGLAQGGRLLSFSPGVQGIALSGGKLDPILEKLKDRSPAVPVYVHTGHHSHSTPAQLLLVARRFPSLTFIMGHSGATDYAADVVPVAVQCKNIFIEASFARPPGFAAKSRQIGFERALMGSGFPYNDLAFEWAEIRRLLPKEYAAQVCGGNLAGLLGESP